MGIPKTCEAKSSNTVHPDLLRVDVRDRDSVPETDGRLTRGASHGAPRRFSGIHEIVSAVSLHVGAASKADAATRSRRRPHAGDQAF
jgi:hypothetical protein